MGDVYIDNDVLHKITVYGLAMDILLAKPMDAERYFFLGAARFIIAKKLRKKPPSRGMVTVLAELEAVLQVISPIEPDEPEVRLAAELEFAAREANVDLDGGESILCATLLVRGNGFLLTGDKRAAKAIQRLIDERIAPPGLVQRLICLEQLFLWMLRDTDGVRIRASVCRDEAVDTALATCFSCRSEQSTIESWQEGLRSYIGDLERSAPDVLAALP